MHVAYTEKKRAQEEQPGAHIRTLTLQTSHDCRVNDTVRAGHVEGNTTVSPLAQEDQLHCIVRVSAQTLIAKQVKQSHMMELGSLEVGRRGIRKKGAKVVCPSFVVAMCIPRSFLEHQYVLIEDCESTSIKRDLRNDTST